MLYEKHYLRREDVAIIRMIGGYDFIVMKGYDNYNDIRLEFKYMETRKNFIKRKKLKPSGKGDVYYLDVHNKISPQPFFSPNSTDKFTIEGFFRGGEHNI